MGPDQKLAIVEKGIKPHKAAFNEEERRVQSVQLMAKRLFEGKTIEQAGEELGLGFSTAKKRIKQARADGVPDQAREFAINELLPEALVVLKEALASPNLKLAAGVALKIVERLEAFELPEAKKQADEEDSLESFSARLTSKKTPLIEGEISVIRSDDEPI